MGASITKAARHLASAQERRPVRDTHEGRDVDDGVPAADEGHLVVRRQQPRHVVEQQARHDHELELLEQHDAVVASVRALHEVVHRHVAMGRLVHSEHIDWRAVGRVTTATQIQLRTTPTQIVRASTHVSPANTYAHTHTRTTPCAHTYRYNNPHNNTRARIPTATNTTTGTSTRAQKTPLLPTHWTQQAHSPSIPHTQPPLPVRLLEYVYTM